jgi:NitT/TauT family transport system ATP-binding protein
VTDGSQKRRVGPDPAATGARFKPVSVDVEQVSMTYPLGGGKTLRALDQVSLNVSAAQFCSIVGPSGCGKSTLLMLIAGLFRPGAGRVLVDQRRVAGPWQGVGMVFQRDLLLEWRTVLGNVLLPVEVKRCPLAPYREQARALLDLVGLREFADSYPDQLSGGMRQRVAICRALIDDPPLLLMDEPFASVDALTREKLNADLLNLTRESPKTVLFVTHSIEEAVLLADQVAVMGPRPGTVLRVFPVSIPRPRGLGTRNDPRFLGLVDQIRATFHTMGLL